MKNENAIFGAVVCLIGLLIMMVIGSFLHGCTAAQRKQIVVKTEQCADAALQAGAVKVVPAVSAVLETNADNWQAQLEGLATGVGLDFVVCAVESVLASWTAPAAAATASSAPTPPTPPARALALSRGRSWLSAKRGK